MDYRMRLVIVALLCCTAVPPRATAQDAGTLWQFRVPTLDMSIRSSKSSGVAVYVAPSIETVEGRGATVLVNMVFPPDSLEGWANGAIGLIQLDTVPTAADGVLWGRRAHPLGVQEYLAVGTEVHGHRAGAHRYLDVVDGEHALRFELTPTAADSLLRLLYGAALASGYAPLTSPRVPVVEGVNYSAVPLQQPTPEWQGRPGRVLLEFVVDVDGSVDPASVVVLLSSHPSLEAEARRTILASRFKPGIMHGEPVRDRVTQVVSFKYK